MEKILDYGSAVAFCKKYNLTWQKKKKDELIEMIDKFKKEKDGKSDLQQTEIPSKKETEKKFQNVDDMLVKETKVFDDQRLDIFTLEELIINNICNKVAFVYDIGKIYHKYKTIDNPNKKSGENLAIEVALGFFLNGN